MSVGQEDLIVTVPFDTIWPDLARQLDGQWHGAITVWRFDPRYEARVRFALGQHFGTDGERVSGATLLIDVCTVPKAVQSAREGFYLPGRFVCHRAAHDAHVQLGRGVSIVAGGFARSGGSAAHPSLAPLPGTLLQVVDVPAPLAQRLSSRSWIADVLYAPGWNLEVCDA